MPERWLRFVDSGVGLRAALALEVYDNEVITPSGYCWVDFPEPDYARIGHSGESYRDTLVGLFVARQIARKYPVRETGSSETGWQPGRARVLLEVTPRSTSNLQDATVIEKEVEYALENLGAV